MRTVELTRDELRTLLNDPYSVVNHNGVRVRRAADRPKRTGSGPTHVGPVRVSLSRAGSWGRTYAFHSDLPVAVGDTVDVDTCNGVQEGCVIAFGIGAYDGPLKSVLAVKVVL